MAEATEDQEENLGPAETRIRKNIHTTLVSKFVEQVQKYQGTLDTPWRGGGRFLLLHHLLIICTAGFRRAEQVQTAVQEASERADLDWYARRDKR